MFVELYLLLVARPCSPHLSHGIRKSFHLGTFPQLIAWLHYEQSKNLVLNEFSRLTYIYITHESNSTKNSYLHSQHSRADPVKVTCSMRRFWPIPCESLEASVMVSTILYTRSNILLRSQITGWLSQSYLFDEEVPANHGCSHGAVLREEVGQPVS